MEPEIYLLSINTKSIAMIIKYFKIETLLKSTEFSSTMPVYLII